MPHVIAIAAPIGAGIPYHRIPFLLFFRSYRTPDAYRRMLSEFGYGDVRTETVELEAPFLLLTAKKAEVRPG